MWSCCERSRGSLAGLPVSGGAGCAFDLSAVIPAKAGTGIAPGHRFFCSHLCGSEGRSAWLRGVEKSNQMRTTHIVCAAPVSSTGQALRVLPAALAVANGARSAESNGNGTPFQSCPALRVWAAAKGNRNRDNACRELPRSRSFPAPGFLFSVPGL
jgi:hypothetical protein